MSVFAELPSRLRTYVLAVIAAGPLAAVLATVAGPRGIDETTLIRSVVLAGFAAVALAFPLWLGPRTRVDLSTIPLLAMVFVLPPAVAAAAALSALLVGQRRSWKDPVETCFNAGVGALSAVLSAIVFAATAGHPWLGPRLPPLGATGALILAAIVFYLVNTGLVMGAVIAEFGTKPEHIWWRGVLDDLPAHLGMAVLAGLAAILIVDLPLALPTLALPALLIYLSLRQMVEHRQATRAALTALGEETAGTGPDTSGHSLRVAELARALALRLGLAPEEAEIIAVAARVHDIGKAAVDPAVLAKPGALDEAEWEQMRQHPTAGADVIAHFTAYGGVHQPVRHHHERWDGTGYPDGLVGEAIPLGARVLAVADAFDAMTSERPYRPAMTVPQALRLLREGAASQWDPRVVAAMVEVQGVAVVASPRRLPPTAGDAVPVEIRR